MPWPSVRIVARRWRRNGQTDTGSDRPAAAPDRGHGACLSRTVLPGLWEALCAAAGAGRRGHGAGPDRPWADLNAVLREEARLPFGTIQRLHLPRTVEAGTLARELMDYEIKVNDHANASFNAKSGSHDDLVIALGLSCGVNRTAGRASSRSYLDNDRDLQRDRRNAERRLRLTR